MATLLLGVFLGFGILIFLISRIDRNSGCFYTLLMILDVILAGMVLIARLDL